MVGKWTPFFVLRLRRTGGFKLGRRQEFGSWNGEWGTEGFLPEAHGIALKKAAFLFEHCLV